MTTPLRVLVVEDRPDDADLMLHELRQASFAPEVTLVDSETAFLAALNDHPEVILTDYNLPQFDAPRVLELLKRQGLDVPIIVVSGSIGEDMAVEMMKRGATDFLLKDRLGRLGTAIRQALDQRRLRQDKLEAERLLRESEARFRLLVEAVRDYAIYLLDVDGHVTSWNAGAERTQGYRSEEVLGRHFELFYVAEEVHAGKPRRELERALAEGRTEDEGWRLRKNGTRFWANCVTTAIHDGTGRLRGFVNITRDLSDRRRAEVHVRSMLDSTLDGIISANEQGKIETFNRSAERTFGYHAAEAIGQSIGLLMAEPDRSEHHRFLADYLATGVKEVIGSGREVKGRRKDGAEFPMELTIKEAEGDQDAGRHFLAIVRDLTERKRLETQLRQAQRMEVIGQLAGGIAHDFNNLLTVILGSSDVLLEQSQADPESRGLITEIHQAGQRAAALTRQLLAFSRQQVVEPKVLDLNVVIQDLEKMLRRLIGEDVLLTTVLSSTPCLVRADQGQIEQIVINMAVNSRDAMPQGGRLTIETAYVNLDERYCRVWPEARPGQYARLSVTDTGCGMDEKVRVRIFEPFFTTKEVGKGTGLGLATVYGIVRQSGGHVEVGSEVGVGTSFKVYLPRTEAPLSLRHSQPGSSFLPRGVETILLVEDEAAVRSLARHVLSSCGYQVLEAANGREALRLAEGYSEPIHMLVSDVVMPYLGGRHLAERLSTLRSGLKVLFLSGYTDDAVVRHGVLGAEFSFLQKPFTPLSIAAKVREVLDQETQAHVGT